MSVHNFWQGGMIISSVLLQFVSVSGTPVIVERWLWRTEVMFPAQYTCYCGVSLIRNWWTCSKKARSSSIVMFAYYRLKGLKTTTTAIYNKRFCSEMPPEFTSNPGTDFRDWRFTKLTVQKSCQVSWLVCRTRERCVLTSLEEKNIRWHDRLQTSGDLLSCLLLLVIHETFFLYHSI